MYFGEFLIENNVVTEEELFKGLLYQMDTMPSIIRILFEKKYLSPSKLLEIMMSQIKMDSDILSIVVKDKYLPVEKVDEILLYQSTQKVPLSVCLINLGLVKTEKMNEMITLFYSNKAEDRPRSSGGPKAPSPSPSKTVTTPPAPVSVAGAPQMSAAALESLKELGMDIGAINQLAAPVLPFQEHPFIEEYTVQFSAKLYNKMNKLMQIINDANNKNDDISNYLNSLYRDVHLLKGCILLSELTTQIPIIEGVEDIVEKVFSSDRDQMGELANIYWPFIQDGLDLLWWSREKIVIAKTDASLKGNSEFVDKLEAMWKKS